MYPCGLLRRCATRGVTAPLRSATSRSAAAAPNKKSKNSMKISSDTIEEQLDADLEVDPDLVLVDVEAALARQDNQSTPE